MAGCKLSICLLVFSAFLGIALAQRTVRPTTPPQPRVSIVKVNNMSPSMQLDASDFLKRAASSLSEAVDRCRVFKELFAEKYPEYTWHVVMYKAVSITPIKSIHLTLGSDRYCLFATKK